MEIFIKIYVSQNMFLFLIEENYMFVIYIYSVIKFLRCNEIWILYS